MKTKSIAAQIEQRSTLAGQAATAAGRLLKENYGKINMITKKGDRNYVTNVDIASEAFIVSRIFSRFPFDSILAEEEKYPGGVSGFKWVIDPLDGTHNFMYGIKDFGVSIAIEYNGEVVAGVIFLPMDNELFSAVKNKGAFCNGKRIRVSRRPLNRSTLVYDSNLRTDEHHKVKHLFAFAQAVFNLRMYGSSVRNLTMIAQGKADVAVEFDDQPWDCAAGLLLIAEAGGKITALEGKPWPATPRGYVASNPVVHQKVLAIVRHS